MRAEDVVNTVVTDNAIIITLYVVGGSFLDVYVDKETRKIVNVNAVDRCGRIINEFERVPKFVEIQLSQLIDLNSKSLIDDCESGKYICCC